MESNSEKPTGLAMMRVPFEDRLIGKLPKESKSQADERKANRDAGKNCALCGGWHHKNAVHLDYVGHAAITDRLLDADLEWNWEPVAWSPNGLPMFDEIGGLWIWLTVKGVRRMGYGNAEKKTFTDMGAREKEVIGDALRNASMRFGAALELWHKGDLHGPADDNSLGDTGAHTDTSRADPPPQQPPEKELPPYKREDFEANLPNWRKQIESGAKTAETIVAFISSRAVLNATQRAKINAIKRTA